MRDSIGVPLTPCFIFQGVGEQWSRRGEGGVEKLCVYIHTQDIYSVIVHFGAEPMNEWVIASLQHMTSSASVRQDNFFYSSKKKTCLEDRH